jgi:hypothetical protein
MLSSATVVFLLSSVSHFQRREDDAVAGFLHGLPAVTPSVGTRPSPAGQVEQEIVTRPTGFERAFTAYDMPIEGRDEWLAAPARHLA